MASSEMQEWSEHHRTQLPSWRRPTFGRRSSDVRTLPRDRLQPMVSRGAPRGQGEGNRVAQLERQMTFLRQQHHDTLQHLHREIERLKNENRELNFKLIMCRCGQAIGKPQSSPRKRKVTLQKSLSGEETDPGTPNDELRTIFLEEEVRELRNQLTTEKGKNTRLMRIVEKKVAKQSIDQLDGEKLSPRSEASVPATHLPSTLQECESVIRHLQLKSDKQGHELMQIKADLRDVLYSHKWTPDAYLMAKAYVAGRDLEEEEEKGERKPGILPKIDPQKKKETLERAYQRVQEGVTLPALKPKFPTSVAERQKRSQTVKGWTTGR